MRLTEASIARPIAVMAAVILALMFGLVALNTIPIQLAPDISRPVIEIRTEWPGAAPAEVEREIINEQEEALKGLMGVKRITSRAREGRGQITLEFGVGQDMDRALLLVSNRLDRVEGYPPEVDEPTLKTAGPEDNRIAWFYLWRAKGNRRPIDTYGDFALDVIQARLERVPGVAAVNVFGGGEREMRVTFDPARLARYGLTVPDVIARLRGANAAGTAGDVDEGKRRYVVRTDGEFTGLDQVRSVLLRTQVDEASGRVSRVRVSDVATVEFGYAKPIAQIRMNGESALSINATRQAGANVIETMRGVRAAVRELADGPARREGLVFRQMYDETRYIDSAIDLVIRNVWMGGILAVCVLLAFLRSWRAALVISLAIPVSVVAAFVAMAALGRSLNVVSLAGIAFAVGMVVDAAIVVLENIYRLREQGKSAQVAAVLGTDQVWGAVLVSTLTTVMVFIPILIMDLEVGQLFRDIAVAISVAVILSLLVSVTVVPALAHRLLAGPVTAPGGGWRLPAIDRAAARFLAMTLTITRGVVGNRAAALGVVGGVTLLAGLVSWAFLPPLEYLPEGNRNLVIGIVFPPPGYNLETTTGIAAGIERSVKPHLVTVSGPDSKPGEPPKLRYFTFIALRQRMFLVTRGMDPARAREMVPMLLEPARRVPGTVATAYQPSIFGRGISGTRSIDMDVTGPELATVIATAQRASAKVLEIMPEADGTQIRPRPSLELGVPEVRVVPDPVRLADNGLNVRDLVTTVDALNDSVRVAEITIDGRPMDLVLKGPDDRVGKTQGIANLPIVTGVGKIVPLSSLAEVALTSGPLEIRHTERKRTVTLQIRPPPRMALGTAIDRLAADVVGAMDREGLPPGVHIRLSGTADKLSATARELRWDLLMALVIVFLVMAVLFESFFYPLIILLSVPLATAGGVIGLRVLNLVQFQALDMLTMLGFVILIGIVVNNAILLVHQTLYLRREEGMAPADAILEATRNRVRPIFMSTLTTVFGMSPLVLFSGAGSELYRGLGSVVVGGLSLSALLTLALVPPLLAIALAMREGPQAAGKKTYPKAAE